MLQLCFLVTSMLFSYGEFTLGFVYQVGTEILCLHLSYIWLGEHNLYLHKFQVYLNLTFLHLV